MRIAFKKTSILNSKQITYVSFGALLIAHLMINSIISNELINVFGLILTSVFIYYFTLRRNDIFSYVMIMYFCTLFPYLAAKGGGFNLVSFIVSGIYIFKRKKFIYELINKNRNLTLFITLFFLSSVLGWCFNYTGSNLELLYSIVSFTGVILLFFISSNLFITPERIRIFLKLNFVLIIYSTIVSLNKYLDLISIKTPMMPIYGFDDTGYFEGGGIIGVSPFYGEHSMILAILFSVFLILGNNKFGKTLMLLFGVFISFVNVFMSISRSVFLLSLVGIVLIYILQFKIIKINITNQIRQIIIVILIGGGILWVIEQQKLGYVLYRVDEIESRNIDAGGISIDRIIDGSAFNREIAFNEGYKKYASKESWFIGYGWGIGSNNRDAYYVDPSIERGSAHSQLFAVLFLFGWIGFAGYFGLIFLLIYKSYSQKINSNLNFHNKTFAFFFFIAFVLFFFNEIKADSISYPTYFGSTIILLGLGFSNLNSARFVESKHIL